MPVIAITGTEGVGTSRVLDGTADIGRRLGFRPEASPSGDAPVLLTVDRAHLVGAARLTEIYGSARRSTGAPVVLAAAGRQRDDGTADWLPAGERAMRLPLRPLSDRAVHDLVTRRLGAPPGADLAGVAAQAAGNPLVLTELVDGLVEEDAIRIENDRARMVRPVLPGRVRRLLHGRLGALPPRYRQLLQVAATLNQNASERTICSVDDLDEAGRRMLDREGSSILLEPTGRRIRFRSVLAWRTVRHSMPALLRTLLHADGTGRPAAGSRDHTPAEADCWARLTDIERSIALLVSDGLTNRQIAKRVFLSPHTVNYHLRNIFRKLDITSRVSLAGIAAGRATVTTPPWSELPAS